MYAPPGYLLFTREGTLMAVPFDAKRLRVTGEAIQLPDQVLYWKSPAFAHFSVSANGVLAYDALALSLARLTWFDRNGGALGTVGPPEHVQSR
jgi:hypothetical protein